MQTDVTEVQYDEWLASLYRPVSGADGEGDDPAEDPAASGDDPVEDPEADPAASGDDPEADPEDPEEDPSEPEELEERLQRDLEETRTKLAKAEAAARQAKADARKAREDAAKKGGNWEQVAKEREAEVTDANERAQNAETRAVEAEEKLDKFQREVRITRLASKLHFRDPEDAIDKLKGQDEVTGEDKACERALRKLAESKPYLVDQRRAKGRAMGGDSNNGALTMAEVEKMSEAEINEAWEQGRLPAALSAGRITRRT